MNTTEPSSWTKSYSREIGAAAQVVWATLIDIANWKSWNPGVKSIQIDGMFTTGTWFSMTLPDNEVIRSKLVEVSEPHRFIDETWVGETLIRVEHQIDALSANRSRVTYAIRTEGVDAHEIGEAVSADFPDVLAGLASHVASAE